MTGTLSLSLIGILFGGLSVWIGMRIKRIRDGRRKERDSITPEALHALMQSRQRVLLFDVRQPLDLLANSEIIPGAQRIAPKEVLANPSLIPRDKESVVYCTCPSDRTSQAISNRARAENFLNVKFLRGGLAAWKAKGYPVVPYEESFRLDTGA